jgi:excisionase family DNA binding protein
MAISNYLTPQEAAAELRVSIGTIYTVIRKHKVPVHRVGSQYRLHRTEPGSAGSGF